MRPSLRFINSFLTLAFAKSTELPGSEIDRKRETRMLDLLETVIRWPFLPSQMVDATLALARSQSSPRWY